MELFETKVRYTKIAENGKEKKVIAPFIISAMSFTDAEAGITEELAKLTSGEFVIGPSITRSKISEISTDYDGDIFYKVKISFVAMDEELGKEKKSSYFMLILANDVKGAHENVSDLMKETISEYVIEGVSDSKIVDYFE